MLLASSIPANATGVSPIERLVITASRGSLTAVTVTAAGGPTVPGTVGPGATTWTASAPLAYDTAYTVTANGLNADRSAGATFTDAFHTVAPQATLALTGSRPEQDDTVGIAMPISLYFNKAVQNRAAVEQRLSVQPSVATEGSFHWVGDDQVNWRPKEYWKPGTTVTVRAALFGLDTGGGTFGKADREFTFTIGKDQRALGNVGAHTFTVFADGQQIRQLPASFGRPRYPTQNGIHVAFEKWQQKRMTSESWGGPRKGQPGWYDEVLPKAVRISNNGEFVHINAATVSVQGRANVSHGCINLSPANGAWFYNFVQIGDPVEIVGSPKPLTSSDGDIADWTIPWADYLRGSALIP